MSIFPKRTLLNKGVTIHWNFNTAHLKGIHIFPFVRIGVKRPDGVVTMLYEGNILALPDSKEQFSENKTPKYKYLNKNTPLLVLADYLSGQAKREVLVDILTAIQSGRHYYFYYNIPDDAPIGKYELISEVHSNGEIRYSKTASDDFFFVEKLEIKEIKKQSEGFIVIVKNLSTEPIPVKIVECIENGDDLSTQLQVFEIPANTEFPITYHSEKTFLLYNEEREIIPLTEGSGIISLRNQQLLSLSKKEDFGKVIYVIPKDTDETFKLDTISKEIWLKADGLNTKELFENDQVYKDAYQELVQSGLIQEIKL
ncbi:hypothetical protein KHA90_15525 [Flavobacterium psychroterrae]|uniref:DUF4380 domain-containing protein n=1 Tax=Flavobacterium psychroterrae TaxID=2133767 RepID=A0ABS5PDQ9_9FLAO|nr:hypothetical protein [Flavobacterium psychroterrae]MBS7232429.1 hypothetical protein [Flavobacterium psychroterrae]